jgi:hypothetical protein
MGEKSKKAGQEFANYLKLLPKNVHDENNRRVRARAEKGAQAFSTAFDAGKCPICKDDLSTYGKANPCLHWLLKPEGFEKRDLLRITERFSMHELELFLRRVANEEAFAKNINDMPMEGSGKCVELTMKYKNLEWAIACGHGDYDGHQSDSEASRRPHYHFQMRIEGLPRPLLN